MPTFVNLSGEPSPTPAPASELIPALKAGMVKLRRAAGDLRIGLEGGLTGAALRDLSLWVYVGRDKAAGVLAGALHEGVLLVTANIARFPFAGQGLADAMDLLRPDMGGPEFWTEHRAVELATSEALAAMDRIIARLGTWQPTEAPSDGPAPTEATPPVDATPDGSAPAETITPDAPDGPVPVETTTAVDVADCLEREGKPTLARLLRFMADRESAAFQDIAHEVHGDDQVGESAIRVNVSRANRVLESRAAAFRFRCAASKVHKESRPVT